VKQVQLDAAFSGRYVHQSAVSRNWTVDSRNV
jgi:hypothetical protein